MILLAVPPWIDPKVSTAGFNGSTLRLTTLCRPTTHSGYEDRIDGFVGKRAVAASP